MNRVTLFMAVPTIYAKLIEYYNAHYEGNSPESTSAREALKKACKENVRYLYKDFNMFGSGLKLTRAAFEGLHHF